MGMSTRYLPDSSAAAIKSTTLIQRFSLWVRIADDLPYLYTKVIYTHWCLYTLFASIIHIYPRSISETRRGSFFYLLICIKLK